MLDLQVGRYHHLAGSLHLYERDWEAAKAVTFNRDKWGTGAFSLPLWGADDIGSIVGRARRLLLNPDKFKPETPFEGWARWQLIAS
jgi:hypothetical protein